MSETIRIESTGAIGDGVIATGLIPGLHEAGFTPVFLTQKHIAPLLEGFEGIKTIVGDMVTEKPVIDIRDYLGNQFVYPDKHLVELMAIELKEQGGPETSPSPDDVRLVLTKDELEEAAKRIGEISRNGGNLPVVIIAPDSTTKNRNLPNSTLQEVVSLLSGRIVSCVMRPNDSKLPDGAVNVWADLRDSAAMLAVADAVVTVDSGPLHMVNAVLQGSKDTMNELGLDPRQSKVVAVLGSSSQPTVVYRGNNVLNNDPNACSITCRAHGYPGTTDSDQLEAVFDREFFPSGVEGDKSLCQYPDYAQIETARCMESITPKRIADAVLAIVDNREVAANS